MLIRAAFNFATIIISHNVHFSLGFGVDRLQPLKVMAVLSFFIAFVVVICIWYYKKFYGTYKLARKLPGPPMWPVIGSALMLLGNSPSEMLNLLLSLTKEFGFVTRLMVGPKLLLMLSDPKDLEVLLGSQKLIDKSNVYDYIKQWLGTGLLISTGQKWFKRRKVITPTFHFKILEQFVDIFDKQSATFVKNLAKFKGQHCDIFPQVTLLALDVICGKIIKVQVNSDRKSSNVIINLFDNRNRDGC